MRVLGRDIINSSVDAATGYATTKIGPRWRQRQPLPINRWNTLLIKWVMAAVLTGLMTGLILLVAAGLLRMDAPHPALLWLLAWLCMASVAVGTVVLFAVLGAAIGQLLASAVHLRGTGDRRRHRAPAGAARHPGVAGPDRAAAPDPRRNPGHPLLRRPGRRRAGRAVTYASLGLVFWLILGAVAVRWYDRKGYNRLDPELLGYVAASVQQYKSRNTDTRPQDPGDTGKQTEPDAATRQWTRGTQLGTPRRTPRSDLSGPLAEVRRTPRHP